MQAVDTRTLTFLFTDIEGSTQRWELHGDAMADALGLHDRLMHAAITDCGGTVFKTVGDAFCAVFEKPEDASRAALQAQRALNASDFAAVNDVRVRMAVHTGVAHVRDEDFFGPTVNRVARLLAIGHGGQMLLSGASADLLTGSLPPGARLRDMGAHQLKDMGDPEHVYQLEAADLPESFPALKSLGSRPNNLPRQFTSFVGREDVLADVKARLEQSSLVTLLGAGGSGKTRCALQTGAELLEAQAEGAWFVELAPVNASAMVASAFAAALCVREVPNRPLLDSLVDYLRRKELLLIVDNCEHVIDGVRDVALVILRSCPGVRIVATSREPLSVAGESAYRIPSLPAPNAMHLFVDRATAGNSQFHLEERYVAPIAEICRRLDGLPLAIELAAARVKVLPPDELVKKLDERFRVLSNGDRSVLPRHQTMRAVIDWSYDLLSDDERRLFRKLSIFSGGFTSEAATAVCAGEGEDEFAILDGITSLIDKSLVQAATSSDHTRYSLLESNRQYAREKLRTEGEENATARAHAAAYIDIAKECVATYETRSPGERAAQLDAHVENIRSALEWAFSPEGDPLLGQRLVAAVSYGWPYISFAEGVRWVEAAQHVDAATDPALAAKLAMVEVYVHWPLHAYAKTFAAAQRALEYYRKTDDRYQTAEALNYLGGSSTYLSENRAGGASYLESAHQLIDSQPAPRLKARIKQALAIARHAELKIDVARRLYEEALELYKLTGQGEGPRWNICASLGELAFLEGDIEAAIEWSNKSVDGYRELNDSLNTALALSNLAAYEVADGRFDDGLKHGREAVTRLHDLKATIPMAFAVQHVATALALDAADMPKALRAAHLLGFAWAQYERAGIAIEHTERQGYDRARAALCEFLGDEEAVRIMDESKSWTDEQAAHAALLP